MTLSIVELLFLAFAAANFLRYATGLGALLLGFVMLILFFGLH
jgi:hypothetical protein